jgi:uncharacterized protein (TIGR03118 family)
MHVQTSLNRSFAFLASLVLAVVLCPAFQAPAAAQYQKTDLVSNGTGAPNHDPNLVNAWGIANLPRSPFWVSDAGSGKSTLYNGKGTPVPLIVTVPPASGTGDGSPTGMVANSTTDFVISGGGGTGPAVFIFDTLDGTISGWNGGTDAVIKVNRSKLHASYTGLAMGFFNGAYYLYAADNVNRRVDMFDANFKFVMSFTDPKATQPPFNVQNINGYLYVTFGTIGGKGGRVDIFGTGGHLITRILSTKFDGPWGLALAPPNFGIFSSALLVGNLNDGTINAYDYRTHALLGPLKDSSGAIVIDGLWALTFGSDGAKDANGQTNQLFFSAGPKKYLDGLFGVIVAK